MNNLMLVAEKIEKTFPQGASELHILKGLDFQIKEGEAVSIVGASGAGKSTFLHILGTLDRPTSGRVLFEGEDLLQKADEELAKFRNEKLGFVFQFHHLLSEFTALENVMLPAKIGGISTAQAKNRAMDLFELLGLSSRAQHFPSELSGGEQQRVAIARALMREPKLLLADEPTGNLDTENSFRIQELFFELQLKLNLSLVVITHDTDFARRFPKMLRMRDGHWD